VTIKAKLLALGVLLALFGVTFCGLSERLVCAQRINSEAKSKGGESSRHRRAESGGGSAEGEVIYRTIYRDVVKYVNDPNHIKCDFDDHAVQLRQRALDAANNIADLMQEPCKGKWLDRTATKTCRRTSNSGMLRQLRR
jgi:hypothetical protein